MQFLRSPLFNVLAFSVTWATQIFVTKLAFLRGAAVLPFTVQSALVACLAALLLLAPRCSRELRNLPARTVIGVLLANATHNGLGGFLANVGTSQTTATNAAFTMQCSTVTTTLMAFFVLGEPLTREKLSTVGVVVLGSFLLLTNGMLSRPGFGELCILSACLCWSTGNVAVRKILQGTTVSPDLISMLRPFAGVPVLILLFGAQRGLVSAGDERALGYLASLCEIREPQLAIANGILWVTVWIFLNRTLQLASASYMTTISSMTPVLVAAMAMPLLGERLTLVQLVGAGLIVGASSLVHRLRF